MTADQASFAIAAMSAVLGASRSGFCARRNRRPSARSLADAALTEKIAAFHARSGGTCGARASMPISPKPASVSGASGSGA